MNRQQKNTVPIKQRTNKGNNPQVRSTLQVRSQDSQDNALQVHSTHQVHSWDNTPQASTQTSTFQESTQIPSSQESTQSLTFLDLTQFPSSQDSTQDNIMDQSSTLNFSTSITSIQHPVLIKKIKIAGLQEKYNVWLLKSYKNNEQKTVERQESQKTVESEQFSTVDNELIVDKDLI